MKTHKHSYRYHQRGLTLVELLMVMGIMVFLAGLIVAGLAAVQTGANENATLYSGA